MTLAESTANAVMKKLGFIAPKDHPDWEVIVDLAQDEIDKSIDSMVRVVDLDRELAMRELGKCDGKMEVLQGIVDHCDLVLKTLWRIGQAAAVAISAVIIYKVIW